MFSLLKAGREYGRCEEILKSIATHGLTSSKAGSIRGALASSESRESLCYNQVSITDPRRIDETVNSLVFDEREGFWTIACERKFDLGNTDSLTYQVSDALLNSVVFVFSCGLKKRGENADVTVHQYANLRLCGTPLLGEDESYFEEVRVDAKKHAILPHDINAILVPMHLVTLVKQVFPHTMVIPVTGYQQRLTQVPIALDMFRYGAVVDGKDILGPNYVRALHTVLAEFPDMQTFGVHLTRLPCILKTNPQLSLEENRTNHLTRSGKILLRLSNLSAAQLGAISAIPEMQILKEDRRKPHSLWCVCPIELKQQLQDVIKPKEEAEATVGPGLS